MATLTEHASHGGEEKSTGVGPDAEYWGSQGMSLRGHSDTLAAERPAEALKADSADEATILYQGVSGTCVRCAIVSAIEDQVKWKTGVELNPIGMLAGLMQRLNHARGTYPSVFDGYEFRAGPSARESRSDAWICSCDSTMRCPFHYHEWNAWIVVS